ncbi:MAG TPA: TetR/AcrR family transcriptional regulator [Candidatus Aphodovivens avicola]|nr:TetR/AcrR family transcriptional regulator [Candidatus Aphodovivens avicola]
MANKQPAVTEQTKTNLRRAFWQLYEQKPIQKITVKQITDLAGYNRGTFYLYFKDVYDLLDDIENKVLEVIGGMMRDLLPPDGHIADAAQLRGAPGFEAAMTPLAQAVRIYGSYARVLLSDRGDPRFKARFKEIVWPPLKRTLPIKRAHSPKEERVTKEYCMAGLIAAICAWLDEDDPLPVDAFIALLSKDLVGSAG